MILVNSPVSVATGVSSAPNTCVGVLCIGDVAIEVNELDLEWSNIYDGDSYVCTHLRVAALTLVHTDFLHQNGSVIGQNIGKFIQALLSNSYTVGNPLRSVTKPNREVKQSYVNSSTSSTWPSSMSLDSRSNYVEASGVATGNPLSGHRDDAAPGSVVCLPPANFAVLYKPSIMIGLKDAIQSIRHHPIPMISSSGVVLPGWAMYRPIEVELVSLDSSIGNDIAVLRVIVNVYFNMSSISSGSPSWHEPAYHKWSVSSSWTVGSKPKIMVKGKLVRRAMVSGPPSLWEWLPRTMPGVHLQQLETASDPDGRTTTYAATYELDYITPLFTGTAQQIMSTQMASSAYFMAYYSVIETATSLVNGGVALETAFETQLQRAQTEAGFQADVVRGMLSLLQGFVQAVNSSISAAKDEGQGAAGRAAGIAGPWAELAIAATSEGVRQQALGVSRFATNKSYDLNALRRIGNSVERTVTIDIVGYPGVTVDTLQVAAFTIAKQVFFGWLTMGIPPAMRFGWLVRSVLNFAGATNLIKELLKKGADVHGAVGAAFAGINAGGIIGDITMQAADFVVAKVLGISMPFGWDLFPPLTIRFEDANGAWETLMTQYVNGLNQPASYSLPRRFPGMIVQPGSETASALSTDDRLSVLLAAMGIHSITTSVAVDHTMPSVRLTLSALFKSVEYHGNTILHSIWRAFGPDYGIAAVESGGGSSMPSISTMIPAILPLATTEGFNHYREVLQNPWWTVAPKVGPQKVLSSPDSQIGTFAHIYFDDRVQHDNRRADTILRQHQLQEMFAHSIYAHGGSIGTGYITPTITPSYSRPVHQNKFYAAGLGAGIAMWHLRAHRIYPRKTPFVSNPAQHLDGLKMRTEYQ